MKVIVKAKKPRVGACGPCGANCNLSCVSF